MCVKMMEDITKYVEVISCVIFCTYPSDARVKVSNVVVDR